MATVEDLKIFGYLREIMNDDQDYSFMTSIIIEYYKQGFAKYFDEKVNKDFMKQIRFGDIVKRLNNDYMVLNEQKVLINAGYYNDSDEVADVTIPLSICEKLENAMEFYSKIHKCEALQWDEFYLDLYIKYDDGFIINKLGGPLKPEYKSIRAQSENNHLLALRIEFSKDVSGTYKDYDQNEK